MANDQSTHLGLRPLRQPFGNQNIIYLRANTSRDIFKWQPIARNNSGQAAVADIGDNIFILGPAVGFLDLNYASLPTDMTDLSQGPYLQSVDGFVAVLADPNQLYIMEADTGGSVFIDQEQIGNVFGFTYLATTGNTTTGIANALLDVSTAATGTGGTFQLVGLAGNINQDGTLNTGSANFTKGVVRIALYQHGPTVVSPAV